MRGHAFSEEEKQDAIRLVAEGGLASAWRETGIPKPTLVRWCKDAGVERFHPERTRAAVDALQQSAALNRERLRSELLERALDILERMDEPHVEFKGKDADEVTYPIAPAAAVQNYATSAAILIDKYRLEMGEATGRQESWTNDFADHEARDVANSIREELARRAHADAESHAERAAVGGGAEGDAGTPIG
jgi:transposase-like protein